MIWVIAIQRDFGNRVDRKNSRFKYTIDKRGLDWFVQELNFGRDGRSKAPVPTVLRATEIIMDG
ncbi:MAG: hypothetical protein WD426_20840 [Anditalea sp.]